MTALRFVLASGSPRRRELLAGLGLTFEVRPADIDETPGPGEPAADLVARLAHEKAAAVAGPDELVLGADSVVELEGRVLGKPVDRDDAVGMLQSLSGRTHTVHTGVAFHLDGGVAEARNAVAVVTTEVTFVDIPATDVAWYVGTGDPLDKAGAYGLQSIGGRLVRSIVGSPTNVMGLPLAETVDLAARLGVDLASFRSV